MLIMKQLLYDIAYTYSSKVFILLLFFYFTPFTCVGESEVVSELKGHVHGSHFECSLPKKRADIIDCAIENHPQIRKAKLNVNTASTLIVKAAERPNPIINTRYVKDNTKQGDVSEFETNLGFIFELGEKRSSRKKVAKNNVSAVKASVRDMQAKIKLVTVLNLYRLKQILDEKKLIDETLRVFSNVTKQLKDLPRLSAEQQASLTLFELAHEDVKMSHAELFEEERKLEHYFHVATGYALHEFYNFLPTSIKKWPKLPKRSEQSFSSNIKKLQSLIKVAKSELALQEAKAWPDIRIGPSFAQETEGSFQSNMYGFNIQLPIPLFQRNEGGIEHAESRVLNSQQHVELAQLEENHERLEQTKIYESTVRVLNKTTKPEELEVKLRRVQDLYLRGVVSSSMFLDSLIQKLTYLKGRNKREMTALNALWSIYLHDGTILEEQL